MILRRLLKLAPYLVLRNQPIKLELYCSTHQPKDVRTGERYTIGFCVQKNHFTASQTLIKGNVCGQAARRPSSTNRDEPTIDLHLAPQAQLTLKLEVRRVLR